MEQKTIEECKVDFLMRIRKFQEDNLSFSINKIGYSSIEETLKQLAPSVLDKIKTPN
ncbi:hypothetical protein AAGG74_17790 [Bacillus mexicanus]|uniref:hypothetical protein n=1 Tax=Bacillus mexicanus TaxID=2834415 RepID=UPI003D25C0B2